MSARPLIDAAPGDAALDEASSYARIWAAVKRIPTGQVASYGQIAAEAGFPRQPRLAGYALHRLPPDSPVPWHRVVNAQGRIGFPSSSAAHREQRRRLEGEGVVFIAGRIDWRRFGWRRGDLVASEAPAA